MYVFVSLNFHNVAPMLYAVITKNTRDWFNPPVSTAQLLAAELLVEKRLRRHSEERVVAAEQALRAAERERDLYRVSAGAVPTSPTSNMLYDLVKSCFEWFKR